MTEQREPVTPAEVERALFDASERMEQARLDLVDRRNAELAAKREYEIGKVRAAADPWCPAVGKNRGEVTVAERQAWIDAQVLDLMLDLEAARNLRVQAAEGLRVAQKQVEVYQSINASVRASVRGGW